MSIARVANTPESAGDVNMAWPTLDGLLGRVFPDNGLNYDSVKLAIEKESLADPVVKYVNSIIHS